MAQVVDALVEMRGLTGCREEYKVGLERRGRRYSKWQGLGSIGSMAVLILFNSISSDQLVTITNTHKTTPFLPIGLRRISYPSPSSAQEGNFLIQLLLLIIKMRRGYSPKRGRPLDYDYQSYSDRQLSVGGQEWQSFCHYNNALYMGDMLSSSKHGKGLLLHDDGATVVSEYSHDTPTGHNIIFRDNSITSILFRNALDYEIAYKADRYIIKIPFSDATHKANGTGCLIDYSKGQILELQFEDGRVVEKILQLDRRVNEDVFKRNAITRAIGVKHEQAFELTFQRPQGMHVKRDLNELIIGYYNERGELHGLAAKLYAENAEAKGNKELCLKPIERGYYRNSQLETFGEKYFSNGNRYIGEFRQGQFEGQGILLCPQQMKWVHGVFHQGKLGQVLDSNSDHFTQNDYQMWTESLWDLHRRSHRWIDLNVELPDELYLYRILQDALGHPTTHVDYDREESAKQGKQRLNKLQHQFQEGYPGNVQRSYVDHELDLHYNTEYEYGHINYRPKSKDRYNFLPKATANGYLREYRMTDPFIDQYQPIYSSQKTGKIRDYYTDRTSYAPTRRRTRFYDDLPSRYTEYQPVDGLYRRTYLQSLERQRGNLKKLQWEDKDYLRNLREELGKSPVHRINRTTPPKYYRITPPGYKRTTSPRYDPITSPQYTRYDKPIYKKYFSYKDPHEAYVHRQAAELDFDRERTYKDYEPSPPRPSRTVPYRSPQRERDYNHPSFIESNYKHWR